MWKDVQSKKSLHPHRRKHHIDDVCHFTFFVENVTYINFSHILYTCRMKMFNYVHAMVLYDRELEMRVMIVQECVVDQLLMM